MEAFSRPSSLTIILLASGRLLLFLHLLQSAVAGSHVETLPGYGGKLPVQLETGYIGVDENEEVQLFYYFFMSQSNPAEDPLMLWINGGPGCSSLGAIFFEIGPLAIDTDNYTAGIPSLLVNEHAWTKGLNILFLDAPVGTGFSYSKTPQGYAVSDTKFSDHIYGFLKKWLEKNSNFLKNPVYLAGEGYSGNLIPPVIQKVLNGNALGSGININLVGYVMGNPGTDKSIDFNSRIPFAHRLAIIPDEMFEAASSSCSGQFSPPANNDQCLADMDAINKLINQLNPVQILDPACKNVVEQQTDEVEKSTDFLVSELNLPPKRCDAFNQEITALWANNPHVQKALHVRQGSIKTWSYCDQNLSTVYKHDISTVVDLHRNFTKTNLRGLIYSGDHDISIPYIATQQWIKSLGLTLEEAWRSWFVDAEVAGYTKKFKSGDFRLTYATVKGAGHFAAQFKAVCSAMVKRWMANRPL